MVVLLPEQSPTVCQATCAKFSLESESHLCTCCICLPILSAITAGSKQRQPFVEPVSVLSCCRKLRTKIHPVPGLWYFLIPIHPNPIKPSFPLGIDHDSSLGFGAHHHHLTTIFKMTKKCRFIRKTLFLIIVESGPSFSEIIL